ncbi:MAG: hypothetical protein ABSD68_02570, partial [Candidatus Micrarchaeales archaeon]
MDNNKNAGVKIILKEKNDIAATIALNERKKDISLSSGEFYDVLHQFYKKNDRLIIPSTSSPVFAEFYAVARGYAGDSKGKKRVNLLLSFVNGSIEQKERYSRWTHDFYLEKAIRERKGACRETTAILQLVLQEEKFQTSFIAGILKFPTIEFHKGKPEGSFKTGGHAWLKVKIGETEYLADPTIEKAVMRYNAALKNQMPRYEESFTNVVIRYPSKAIVINPTRLEGNDSLFFLTFTHAFSETV